MFKKTIVFSCLLCLFTSCIQAKDSTEKKIENLIEKMTLEEKIGQMNQLTGSGLSEDMKQQIKNGKVGSIINEIDLNTINELQRIAVEESRLGIPLLFGRDVIHGFKTIFPIPLGQAATWNTQLIEDGARVAAKEASSVGIRWTFAPMIDIARDPRWGRVAESGGEDPYLTSAVGTAMVRGFQGKNLSDPQSIAACAKHFVGYGAAEAGKDYNSTWIPEIQLRETYLPPFKAVADAGIASFMCSFNDINGVPSSGNRFINQQILRNEWKYDGMLVSDWASIEQMISHGVCRDLKDAAKKSADAGVDMDMMGFAYANHLEELVKSGKVSEKTLNEAVRNILRMKFRLGLFDQPYSKAPAQPAFYTSDALQKAKQTAIESVVLLKNEALLPLTDRYKSVAVIGPLANAPAEQIGTWCFDGDPTHSVTPLKAIQQSLSATIQINYAAGLQYSRDKSNDGFSAAIEAAKKSEVILFFAGEEAVLSGEAHCRANLDLPGAQTALLDALKQTGKPIVLVVMAGRPLTIGHEAEISNAVLYAFHGGTMAGPALSDLIWGKSVPSGKLPITVPRMVGQIPTYYAHKQGGRPAKDIILIDDIPVGAPQTSLGNTTYHLDAGDKPLFPFGFGLSYTTFSYSEPVLSKKIITGDESIRIECKITNTGKYDGAEVVQCYVRDLVGSIARPVKELKGFQKIQLKAGESKLVSFTIDKNKLAFWNADMKFEAEPGDFQVWISSDSQSGKPIDFTLK